MERWIADNQESNEIHSYVAHCCWFTGKKSKNFHLAFLCEFGNEKKTEAARLGQCRLRHDFLLLFIPLSLLLYIS